MQLSITHLIGGLVAIALLIGGAFAAGTQWTAEPESQEASVAQAVEEEVTEEEVEEVPAPADTPLYSVVRIVDGDTIVVSIDGKNESVRMIGVDTPELNDSRTGVQCFAREAADETKRIAGAKVRLESDASQGERDKYKRLLAYVFSENGVFLNRALIAGGYAHEYTYDDAYKYQKIFKEAESEARTGEKGLWSATACPPETKQTAKPAINTQPTAQVAKPEPTPPPQTQQVQQSPQEPQSQPAPAPVQEQKTAPPPAPPPAPQSNTSSGVVCSSNTYNCSDFKTKAEAQTVYDQCGGVANDIHRLDNNKDGSACDSLP